MKVLVCTDFTTASAAGEREAARRFPRAVLVLFHAVETRFLARMLDLTGADGGRMRDYLLAHADQRLREVAERLSAEGRRVIPELHEGNAIELALKAAHRHGVELIVFGVKAGSDLGRFRTLMGRQTRVPILLVPEEEEGTEAATRHPATSSPAAPEE